MLKFINQDEPSSDVMTTMTYLGASQQYQQQRPTEVDENEFVQFYNQQMQQEDHRISEQQYANETLPEP